MLYLGFVGHLRSLLNTLICLFTAFINVNTILSSLAVYRRAGRRQDLAHRPRFANTCAKLSFWGRRCSLGSPCSALTRDADRHLGWLPSLEPCIRTAH